MASSDDASDYVEGTWAALSLSLALSEFTCHHWKKEIWSRYTEPHRHYHTLRHIHHMLSLCERHAALLQDVDAVRLAVIFHDIIYEPKAPDNEEKSADVFLDFAKNANILASRTDNIHSWILATKHHTTEAHRSPSSPGTDDLHYLLDMDMAGLGPPPQEYRRYASNIRKEYIHVPEEEYRFGRAQLLETFLGTPFIFSTSIFRELYETKARTNIQDEIDYLRNHGIYEMT